MAQGQRRGQGPRSRVLPDSYLADGEGTEGGAVGPDPSYSLAPGHLGFQPFRDTVDEIFDRRLGDAR